METQLEALRDQLREFAAERDWEQFHTPKNLSKALAGGAGELAAALHWATPTEPVERYSAELEEEAADVLIYLIRLADVANIDLVEVARNKIARNGERYAPKAE